MNTQKPQPKYQLVIEIVDGGELAISAGSIEARNWIKEEAPEYGALFKDLNDNKLFALYVHDRYDIYDVKRYLERMGRERAAPEHDLDNADE